jgi:(p)ppGpp synthase/HD superfamily hydrolase
MSTIERAIAIAAEAHTGQVDKAGEPYILHPLRVMLKMNTNAERIVAVLHDLIEDTNWTLDELRAEGFPEEIVAGVEAMTHGPNEAYEDYVLRAGRNAIARQVKLADLEDNSDLSRIPHPTEKDHARIEKYRRAFALLREQAR